MKNINHYLSQIVLLALLIGCLTTQRVQAQCTGVAVEDSLALVDFYNATNGENWDLNRGWLVGPVIDWYGIFLTSDNCHVEKIVITDNNLEGVLHDLQLPNLTELWLSGNDLSGTIPDFNHLPNLTNLWLSDNDLSGTIPDFNHLPNLIRLRLRINGFSGNIPDFSHLPNLIELWLNDNDLSGTIPDFSNLPKLENLSLSVNTLSGTIPDFSNLPKLAMLSLSQNPLSGTIPDFSNLPKLWKLGLVNNNLSGSIPDFNNLPNLEWLNLNDNDLSGAIPDFSHLPKLELLLLNRNVLSDSIPNFSNLPKLERLSLYSNALLGGIPNFSNLPKLDSLDICPNNLQGGIPTFLFCPLLDVENIDFSCLQLAQVSGHVFYDENANCLKEENEKGIPDVFIYTDDEQFITTTDENGFYVLKIDTGAYTFASSSLNTRIWSQSCPEPSTPHTAILTTYSDSIGNFNYAYEPSVYCPQMKVEIGSPGLFRCFDNKYTVNYCNTGTTTAENAYIELYFPEELMPLSSSIPYVQADDHLIFDLGDVGLLESGSFTVLNSVNCEAVLGSTACVDAYVYPDDPCVVSSVWSGADLILKGKCFIGDSIQFIIKNKGSDMAVPSNYKMYEDDILLAFETFQLESGDSIVLSRKATGATFRLTIKQSLGHPSGQIVTGVIEGCGDAPFSFGLVNTQWDGDDNPLVDYDCQEIVGSFDPNDKTVFPSGVLAGNHIPDSIDLTYRIRFQNTGNALAFRVVVIDTIDTEQLQITSLELGAYSHDFDLTIEDGNILIFTFNDILLPDSTSNEAASHGFITYTLAQKEGNAIGDLITNEAAIYFDYNEPVITNQVFNTVGIPDTVTANFVYTNVPETTIYEYELLATVYHVSAQMNIQITPVQAGERFSLQLFNVLGQEMRFIPNLSVPMHQELLSQVQAGVYIYHIQSSEGRTVKGKMLVR